MVSKYWPPCIQGNIADCSSFQVVLSLVEIRRPAAELQRRASRTHLLSPLPTKRTSTECSTTDSDRKETSAAVSSSIAHGHGGHLSSATFQRQEALPTSPAVGDCIATSHGLQSLHDPASLPRKWSIICGQKCQHPLWVLSVSVLFRSLFLVP